MRRKLTWAICEAPSGQIGLIRKKIGWLASAMPTAEEAEPVGASMRIESNDITLPAQLDSPAEDGSAGISSFGFSGAWLLTQFSRRRRPCRFPQCTRALSPWFLRQVQFPAWRRRPAHRRTSPSYFLVVGRQTHLVWVTCYCAGRSLRPARRNGILGCFSVELLLSVALPPLARDKRARELLLSRSRGSGRAPALRRRRVAGEWALQLILSSLD